MNDASLALLVVVLLAALLFEYVNGFHDAANAIATSVRTKALTMRQALLLAAFFNVAGSFMGVAVAKTIGSGLVEKGVITNTLVLSVLLSAIAWGLLTWWWGLPSSSSHALIGSLIGAAVSSKGFDAVQMAGVSKVMLSLFISPLVGFWLGWLIMLKIRVIVGGKLLKTLDPEHPDHDPKVTEKVNRRFRRLQVGSAGIMAFSHGSNDAQKTMAMMTMALVAFYTARNMAVPTDAKGGYVIETWVVLLCALVMGIGTYVGGKRIIKTMGDLNDIRPEQGFSAETAAAVSIGIATATGVPVSTTHVIGSAVMGVGIRGVCRIIAAKMISAWMLTIPVCAVLAAGLHKLLACIL